MMIFLSYRPGKQKGCRQAMDFNSTLRPLSETGVYPCIPRTKCHMTQDWIASLGPMTSYDYQCERKVIMARHPETELQGVLQGPISPRNRLICIQQRPPWSRMHGSWPMAHHPSAKEHVVTCDLSTTVISKITGGILHRQ